VSAKYPSLRIEGGFFAADLLESIAAGGAPGQKPRDFGFDARVNLLDRISRVWSETRAFWKGFEQRAGELAEGETGTTFTRNQWMIPLLSCLGYDPRYQERAAEADGLSFAISHRAGPEPDSPPVHIVGAGQNLDERAASGRPRLRPHSLVQEYLNRTEHLWGAVTNGRRLRLLRNSQLLRRQAYLEFDLETIFAGEGQFADFALLFRLLHRSRLPSPGAPPESCWLERWYQYGIEQGGRVRERLRDGVEEAMNLIANAILRHPKNTAVRECVASGELSARELYEELLRLIYRLLFLMVTEERGLLTSNRVYQDYYSISRLRRLAETRAGRNRHTDLWAGLWSTFSLFTNKDWGQVLGVPPLNGHLFDIKETERLHQTLLANRDFLDALWRLSTYREDRNSPPSHINYAALDTEELGSVYESLLEQEPVFENDHGQPVFRLLHGLERKTTGSYYTPPQLVDELVASALEPVIEARLREARRLAGGERRRANGEREEGNQEANGDSNLSAARDLAAGDEPRGTDLRSHAELSERRDFRSELPDATRRGLRAGQHRGGLGKAGDHRIPALPPHRPGQPAGARDTFAAGAASGTVPPASGRNIDGNHQYPGQADSHAPAPASAEAVGGESQSTSGTQRSTRHSPLTIRHSPLATHHSPFATHHSPFATRYSQLAEQALLSITVCDPAAGSGHFLLAAARRLGRELAQIRTGEHEPSPADFRQAVRDVIGHSIYGVDKNPLAVELCKVALWLESHAVDKPLSFLDHRILLGDSLVGVRDLSVLEKGIPDDAYKPVTGDDKAVAREFKKQNKKERQSPQQWLRFEPETDLGELVRAHRELGRIPDDTPADIRRKQALYDQLHAKEAYLRDRSAADLWTCAFFASLDDEHADHGVPRTEHLRAVLEGRNPDPELLAEAGAEALRLNFFHWPLEFPEVFARGGFDVVLCNPPWERIKLQEQEFFASRDLEIARAPNKAARARLIKNLPAKNPDLWREYAAALHDADALSKFLRASGMYPLTARGDINTYSVFAERFTAIVGPRGRVGAVLPTGIATDDTNKRFFASVATSGRLASLFDFENREGLFPAVDSRMKFSLVTLRGAPPARSEPARFAFFLTRAEQLRDEQRIFPLAPEDFTRLNPNTKTCPIFRTRADAELTRKIYERVPVLINEATGENPWGIRFATMFHMSNDSHLFRTRAQLEAAGYRLVGNRFVRASGERRAASGEDVYLPVYEGKMFMPYDHRFADVIAVESAKRTGRVEELATTEHESSTRLPIPRYWISESLVDERLQDWPRHWLIGFKDITAPTNERTALFAAFPRSALVNKVPVLLAEFPSQAHAPAFLGCFNSLILDFVARQKIGGTTLNFFYLKQFAVLSPSAYRHHDLRFTVPRALELTSTAWDLQSFLDDVWREADAGLRRAIERQWQENREATGGHPYDPPEWYTPPKDPCRLPPFKWDEDRRARLRAELDAYYAKLYGLNRKQLRYIFDPADLTPKELDDILDPWEEVEDPLDEEAYRRRAEQSTFPGETFRVLKNNELRRYGEYRTRRLVLEAWERL